MTTRRLEAAPWLARPETRAVFAALTAEGAPARAVGGCVRNSLLGVPVTDVDIATPAPPEVVMRLAREAGLEALPTGIEHGTVTILSGHVPHEVTTLRRDVTTDGRRAVVAFTDDWAEDASRRDFTMNALYCDADGRLHDPLGGVGDLEAGRVRFIGEARARIREDYLRILRFFRFHASYGRGDIDGEGVLACVREREGLRRLSAERVGSETKKLLVAPRALASLERMFDTGLLLDVLRVVPRLGAFSRLVAIEAALGSAPDMATRLALLGVETVEELAGLEERLRLSRVEAEAVASAMGRRGRPALTAGSSLEAARVLRYRSGAEAFRRRLLADWARSGDPPESPAWRRLLETIEAEKAPELPIAGRDLVALGLRPGPGVGQLLRELEALWIASDFELSRRELVERATAAIGQA